MRTLYGDEASYQWWNAAVQLSNQFAVVCMTFATVGVVS